MATDRHPDDPKDLVRRSYDRISRAYRELGFAVLWTRFIPEDDDGHVLVCARRPPINPLPAGVVLCRAARSTRVVSHGSPEGTAVEPANRRAIRKREAPHDGMPATAYSVRSTLHRRCHLSKVSRWPSNNYNHL
jgi:hypothetical protein